MAAAVSDAAKVYGGAGQKGEAELIHQTAPKEQEEASSLGETDTPAAGSQRHRHSSAYLSLRLLPHQHCSQ
ncbi:hypothetical protein AOLI_G00210790 [Acnodon oligacanthus]